MAKQYQRTTTDDADNSAGLRERASGALDQYGGSAAQQVEAAPLVAVAGGLALGALVAAILPQTDRETRLLQPVGSKVHTAGRNAVEKAREAGKSKVDELAGDRVREFFGMSTSGGGTAA